MRITETQRKIIVLLNAEPKTIEELNNQLDLGFDVITDELNKLIKLNIVKKTEDFPTKYKLDDFIVKEIRKRKEIEEKDSYRIKVQMIIDIEGVVEDVVKLHLQNIKKILEKEQDITIYKINVSDLLEQDNVYFGYVDVTFTVKDFRTLLHIVMFYTPSSIEVLEPKRLDISMFELQDGLIEVAQRTQQYVRELQKRLTKEETDLLMKKLFKH